MRGKQLEVVSVERDLCVIIASNLKVEDHCQQAYATANRMLGLVARTVKHRNISIMVHLYKSLVRPHLEYSASVWNPHYQKDKLKLEKVQRRFTRLFDGLRSWEYKDRLEVLKLWSLEERRHRSDLIELFKMARGLSAIPLTNFFKFSTTPFGSTIRGHSWKLIKAHSNTDTRLYFFSSRVLNRWNSLLQQAVSSSTVNIFKGHLGRTKSVKMGFSWTTGPLNPNAALCIHVYNVTTVTTSSSAWTIWSAFDLKLYWSRKRGEIPHGEMFARATRDYELYILSTAAASFRVSARWFPTTFSNLVLSL